ncbi:MAG: TetR/AcrR family transcriptional regulator [Microscillaceae bacterium]|jgi:AcrR family transcriptional regulator|nr:TetR/AcrR family transcriptional regulator [Microscillaceae bacterium]
MESKEKEEVSEKILQVAEDLFSKYGIRSVSMDDIARELGMSKKTIYQYFKDKNEMVVKITEGYMHEDEACMIEIEQASSNAVEAVLKMSDYFRQAMSEFNPAMIYDIKKYHPDAWHLHQSYAKTHFIESFERNYAWGVADGLYRKDLNIRILAHLRLAEINLTFDESVFSNKEFNVIEVHVTMTEHFLRGILTEQGFEIFNQFKK